MLEVSPAADGITALNADDVPYEMRLYAGFEPVAFANDDQFIMTMFVPPAIPIFAALSVANPNDHFEGEVESFFSKNKHPEILTACTIAHAIRPRRSVLIEHTLHSEKHPNCWAKCVIFPTKKMIYCCCQCCQSG